MLLTRTNRSFSHHLTSATTQNVLVPQPSRLRRSLNRYKLTCDCSHRYQMQHGRASSGIYLDMVRLITAICLTEPLQRGCGNKSLQKNHFLARPVNVSKWKCCDTGAGRAHGKCFRGFSMKTRLPMVTQVPWRLSDDGVLDKTNRTRPSPRIYRLSAEVISNSAKTNQIKSVSVSPILSPHLPLVLSLLL